MSLSNAAADIRYLLDRGFPQKGAINFVCNHYRLDEASRHLLARSIIKRSVCEKRMLKFLPCDKITGNRLIIDGYNIIIGMESILNKKAIYCDDGVIRDTLGISRDYRTSSDTFEAIDLILSFLEEIRPSEVLFLLDAQISKSGQFAQLLKEKLIKYGLSGDARTSKHADYDLKHSQDIVATSDGVIIDYAERVVNFLFCVLNRHPEFQKNPP